MKKTVFLILSGIAIFISGCTSSNYGLLKIASTSNALVNTSTPAMSKNDARGICLTISPRASVDIDVECILDYVQGNAIFDPAFQRQDHLAPWISYRVSF
jgi:uncharacterized alkaline shock family protein YloU